MWKWLCNRNMQRTGSQVEGVWGPKDRLMMAGNAREKIRWGRRNVSEQIIFIRHTDEMNS